MLDAWDLIKSSAFGFSILASYLFFNWLLGLIAEATNAADVWYNIISHTLSVYTVISIALVPGLTLVRLIRERIRWAFGSFKEGEADETK